LGKEILFFWNTDGSALSERPARHYGMPKKFSRARLTRDYDASRGWVNCAWLYFFDMP
jgi:hypothetical protein